jgi:hypothetical protein
MHGKRYWGWRTVMRTALMAIVATLYSLPPAANAQDAAAKQAFVTTLQNAVRADDKNWLADHMSFPVQYFGKQRTTIASRAAFVAGYASFMSPRLKAAVLAQDAGKVFENWQGAMIGDGDRNIWISQVGSADNAPYRIITINDGP